MDPFDDLDLEDSPQEQAGPAAPAPRRSVMLWLVAVGLGILILPLSQIAQTVRADNLRLSGELDNAQTAVGQTPTVGKEAAALQSTIAALQAQANVLNPLNKNLSSKQVNWVDTAAAIADYDHAHMAVTGLEQHDNRIVITGRADNDTAVMAYATALENSGRFSRVVVQSISGVSTPFTTPTLGGALDTTAQPIYLGEPQTMAFDVPGRSYVLTFLAKAGRYYQVSTGNLSPGVDTALIVTLDGGTTFANDDAKPGVLSSEVDFQSPPQNVNATIQLSNTGRFSPDSGTQIVVKEIIPTPTPKAGSGGASGGSGSAASSVSVAATAAPTSTPAPTDTPAPTKTPRPTATRAPTLTQTVTPSITPSATSTADLRDALEPDDVTPAPIGVGGTQARNFFPASDVDAASFYAKQDRYYQVLTSGLAAGVDTQMQVAQGTSTWQNDDYAPAGTGNYASMVCFQAPTTGDAVVTISNKTGLYGPEKTYTLGVVEVAGVLTSPANLDFGTLVQGNPTPAAPLALNLSSTVNADWTITSDQPWLTVDKASGKTPSPVQVSVDPDAMPVGPNSATLTITWSTACTRQIAVTAVVNPAGGSVLGLTRFARPMSSRYQSAPAASINAGTPGLVEAVDFAILVEIQTVKP